MTEASESTVLDYHLQARPFVNREPQKFGRKQRLLKSGDSSRPYTPDERNTSALHWGQRKLMMSEIEFLTLHGDKAQLVVYAGEPRAITSPIYPSCSQSIIFICMIRQNSLLLLPIVSPFLMRR